MKKIVLGTAQFSGNYGVTRKKKKAATFVAKPSPKKVAAKNNSSSIDQDFSSAKLELEAGNYEQALAMFLEILKICQMIIFQKTMRI